MMTTYVVVDFTPAHKNQPTTIEEQDIAERILAHRNETGTCPCTTETKIDHMGR